MRVRWLAIATTVCVALTLVLASGASAASKPLFAAMSGQNEIGQDGKKGAGDRNGGGSFTAVIKGRQLCYGLAVKNIAKPAAAHIHRGGPNTAGDIVVPLESLPVSGDPGSSAGCTQLSQSLVRQIRRNPGGFYVNVHTRDFPDGAIRGQLFARGA